MLIIFVSKIGLTFLLQKCPSKTFRNISAKLMVGLEAIIRL